MILPMAAFPAGSAYAMVRDIAEGYLAVTERTLTRLTRGELDQMAFELERHLREIRGDQPPLEDLAAIQRRNRKIQRLNQAFMILRAYRQKKRI